MNVRTLLAAASLAVVSACAPLTAEEPLFAPADTSGPPPLAEGVWVQLSDTCEPEDAPGAGLPAGCARTEVQRLPDGSWRFLMWPQPASDDENRGETLNEEPLQWRFALAPATERDVAGDYAPLYIAEYSATDDPTILYAVIVPIGDFPARELLLLPMIECSDALRDGAIAGVEEERQSDLEPRACYAHSQAAVRLAARRALVERLPDLVGDNGARFVFFGPSVHRGAFAIARSDTRANLSGRP